MRAGRPAAPPPATWRRTATARATALTSAAGGRARKPEDRRRQSLVRLGPAVSDGSSAWTTTGMLEGTRLGRALRGASPASVVGAGTSPKPTTPADGERLRAAPAPCPRDPTSRAPGRVAPRTRSRHPPRRHGRAGPPPAGRRSGACRPSWPRTRSRHARRRRAGRERSPPPRRRARGCGHGGRRTPAPRRPIGVGDDRLPVRTPTPPAHRAPRPRRHRDPCPDRPETRIDQPARPRWPGVHDRSRVRLVDRHAVTRLPAISAIAAMRTGTPLATWRVMTERGPDATSGGSSTPSLTGPGCITMTSGRAACEALLGQAPACRVGRLGWGAPAPSSRSRWTRSAITASAPLMACRRGRRSR